MTQITRTRTHETKATIVDRFTCNYTNIKIH